MNGIEQRKHTRVTDEIAASVEALAEASAERFTAFENRLTTHARELRAEIGEERTHRLRLADEQRSYVDAADRSLERHIARQQQALENQYRRTGFAVDISRRGFWGRVNWLLTGR